MKPNILTFETLINRIPIFNYQARYIAEAIFQILADFYYGIDTRKPIPKNLLDDHLSDYSDYAASHWFEVAHILRSLRLPPGGGFLDLGCGKGRMLVIAAMFPFEEVIGVEVSKSLADLAKKNVGRYFLKVKQAAGLVTVVQKNAFFYEIPAHVKVIFVFNPFRGKTFRRVLGNVGRSLEKNPRPLHLIYVWPIEVGQLKRQFEVEELTFPGCTRFYCRTFRLLRYRGAKSVRSTGRRTTPVAQNIATSRRRSSGAARPL